MLCKLLCILIFIYFHDIYLDIYTSTHARRTARASSIDEKGPIVKSKATSAPPRAGTTGIIDQVIPLSDTTCLLPVYY